MRRRTLLLVWLITCCHFVTAWHACEGEGGAAGICPDGNRCCQTDDDGPSTCISGKGSSVEAQCCSDGGRTGCGENFRCDPSGSYCLKSDPDNHEVPADKVPRYRLCSLPPAALKEVHGLQVLNDSDTPQLAYLSTKGALDSVRADDRRNQALTETVVVVIHGSKRNVDDYLCCTNAALPEDQREPASSSYMVVAPWLLSLAERNVTLVTGKEHLRWEVEEPIPHTWRYGADALNANFSSYAAVDVVIDRVLADRSRFPVLKRIVVAGHSAGGQLVQRWALLSSSRAFSAAQNITVRTVVANPKSLCWLDDRRWFDGEFRVPDEEEFENCPTYNEWEWGFGGGRDLPTPYKDRAIAAAGGVDRIIERYAGRDVVYLAGERDTIWNGDCEARMQGANRKERSQNFYDSLQEIYGRTVHRRIVVKDVHHDHCLMFQSPEGQLALFGTEFPGYERRGFRFPILIFWCLFTCFFVVYYKFIL